MNKVILLYSGGIDSTVLYYWLLDKGFDVFPMHINYGQVTYYGELRSINNITNKLSKRSPIFINIPELKNVGKGSLIGDIQTSNFSQIDWMEVEFFPNRNMILLSIAASYAYKLNVNMLSIGVTGINSYKDTNGIFIKNMEQVLSISLYPIKIIAPFVDRARKFVINEAMRLNVPIEDTFSCNCLGDRHCLLCSSCLDRQEALEMLGKYNAF